MLCSSMRRLLLATCVAMAIASNHFVHGHPSGGFSLANATAHVPRRLATGDCCAMDHTNVAQRCSQRSVTTSKILEIKLTNAKDFVMSISEARIKIRDAEGKKDQSARDKPAAEGQRCYATRGFTMRIIRPGMEESGPTVTRDFAMENGMYITFAADVPHTYAVSNPWMWSTATFDKMLGYEVVKGRPAAGGALDFPLIANLYSISEAIRFDWMRNRIALVLKGEKKESIWSFSVPYDQLLQNWSTDYEVRLGVGEDEAKKNLATQGFKEKWIGTPFQNPTFPDMTAVDLARQCESTLVPEICRLQATTLRERAASMRAKGGDEPLAAKHIETAEQLEAAAAGAR